VVSNCTDHGLRVAVCPSFPTLKEAQDIHGSIKNRQVRFNTALQLLCIHRPPHTNDLDGIMALYLLCISPPLHRLLLAIHYRPTHKMAHQRTKAGRPIAPIALGGLVSTSTSGAECINSSSRHSPVGTVQITTAGPLERGGIFTLRVREVLSRHRQSSCKLLSNPAILGTMCIHSRWASSTIQSGLIQLELQDCLCTRLLARFYTRCF
jgi:hypothetical protein